VIIDEKAELFLWDRDEGYFVREASASAKIVQRKGAKFLFFLTATSQEGQVLAIALRRNDATLVTGDMVAYMEQCERSGNQSSCVCASSLKRPLRTFGPNS